MPIAPAQLQQVFLGRAQFAVNVDFNAALHSEGLTYEVEPAVGIPEQLDRDDEGLRGAVQLVARVVFSRPDAEETDEPLPLPFELEVEVWGIFAWSSADMPDDDLGRSWLEYNGMYLMWPYLRSYIATITGMSALPQLTIYTMNVPRPPVLDGDDEPSEPTEAEVDAPLAAEE